MAAIRFSQLLMGTCLLLLVSSSVLESMSAGDISSLIEGTLGSIPAQANEPFPEFVANMGYPCEAHYITTEDGYINTYFRIQAKHTTIQPNLPVVYFQHGLLDSADSQIFNSEDQAPAFILAQAGYDVWCGNTRGNVYSQAHVEHDSSNSSSAYWDFTWQEMSQYDLPAAFQYIYQATGQKITYIGHSQGTTIMFAALARRDPTILEYLKHYIALAPVVYVDHLVSPIMDIVGKMRIGIILHAIDHKKFLFLDKLERKAMEILCKISDAACLYQLRLFSDTKTSVDNIDRLDVAIGHEPMGTSTENMVYWNQMVLSKEFKMFDYGKKENEQIYGQPTPPFYDLGQINVPVYLFAGIYDELAYLNSTETVREQLTGSPLVWWKTYPLGHASFLIGKNVTGYFNDVLEVIKSP